MTVNCSSVDDEYTKMFSATHFLSQCLLSLICAAGCTGNIVSAISFRSKCLRNSSCSLTLASRCLTDALYLLTSLLLQFMMAFESSAIEYEVTSVVLLAIQNTTRQISSWLFVILVFENLVVMKTPNHSKKLNAENRLIKIIATCVVKSCVINIGYVVVKLNDYLSDRPSIETIISYSDVCLSFLFSVLLSLFVMIGICQKIKHNTRRRQSIVSMSSSQSLGSQISPERKVAKILTIYLVTMILLLSPTYVLQILTTQGALEVTQKPWKCIHIILQDLFQIMCCVNASIHFFVFNKHSSNFRKALFQIVLPKEALAKRKQSINSESENAVRRRNTISSNHRVCFELQSSLSEGKISAALYKKTQSMPDISRS